MWWVDRASIKAFHEAALATGAKDNGAPGPRGYHPDYYGAVCCFGSEFGTALF
jgi:hypothetical protein